MSRRNVIGVAVAVAMACMANSVRAQTLGIGSPAPKIEVKEFVKGEPVKSFEQGKIYVVEFWATWCPPCRTSIPHLTEMQKKYKDVVFIGVSVFERTGTASSHSSRRWATRWTIGSPWTRPRQGTRGCPGTG